MKIKDIPQDKSALENFTREVCYAKDENGKYQTALSEGWNIKKEALDTTWEQIEKDLLAAYEDYQKGFKSPVYFYMIKSLMDIALLSKYTGFWKITIKRHFTPKHFDKLPQHKLEKYASAFDISLSELKAPKL